MALTIQRLSDSQIVAAKAVIAEVCIEFFGQSPADFDDMAQISSHYTEPSGTFLVLMDGERVVGTGAIRRFDEQTCELKRMWFLPAYRGKGYGAKMSEALLDFSCAAGYKRVRLDTA
jgi:putative acetyltransferase